MRMKSVAAATATLIITTAVLTSTVATPASASTSAAAVTAAPRVGEPASAAVQPAEWSQWILQGPYSTALACDDQWASVYANGVQETGCTYGSGNPGGWYFYFRYWF